MKLAKRELNKVIAGMGLMLQPAFNKIDEVVSGSKLMDLIGSETLRGKFIEPKEAYGTGRKVDGLPVNHTRAIKKIVAAAKTEGEMQDGLAAYVVRYGKPRDEVKKIDFSGV